MRKQDAGPPPDLDALRAMGYEGEDLNIRPILRAVGFLFIFVAAAAGLVVLLYRVLVPAGVEAEQARPQTSTRRVPPDPALQAEPTLDMRRFREQEEARLNGYGWVDRQRGVAHIPIDAAVERVLERGLPAVPRPAGGSAGGSVGGPAGGPAGGTEGPQPVPPGPAPAASPGGTPGPDAPMGVGPSPSRAAH